MSENFEDKKRKPLSSVEPDDESQSGSGESGGGQSGKIEFRDFLATGAELRDDQLSPEELKRLLSTHKDINEAKVKQQKDKRDQYKDLKEGKVLLQSFREGLRGSGSSNYKVNPILADKAQFSGIDRKVSTLPTENIADTNEEKRNELENELRYRLAYQPTPTFNPKPRGPG